MEPKLEDSSGEEWQGEGESDKITTSRMNEFSKGRKRDFAGKVLPSDVREEVNRAVEKLLRRDGGVWSCQVCSKTADHKTGYNNLKQHIKTHLPLELRERGGSSSLRDRRRRTS